MPFKLFRAGLLLAAVVAFAPGASAQVESSPTTEESRSLPVKPAPAALGPRRNPPVFGVGVAATVVGGVAVPAGGVLIVAHVARGVGQGFDCAAQLGRQCHSSSDAMGIAGAVLLVSGIVLLAAGVPMIVVGGKRLPKDAAFEPFVVRF